MWLRDWFWNSRKDSLNIKTHIDFQSRGRTLFKLISPDRQTLLALSALLFFLFIYFLAASDLTSKLIKITSEHAIVKRVILALTLSWTLQHVGAYGQIHQNINLTESKSSPRCVIVTASTSEEVDNKLSWSK